MINLVWSGLLTLLLLSGCGFDGTTSRSVTDFLPLTSIEITAVYPTIASGTSTALKVNGFYKGLSTPKDITDQAVWSSSSTGVADFIHTASPIRAKGINPGTAILTATVGGVSATYTLTVSNATVTSIAITPAAPTIVKGLTTQFTASGTLSGNTTQDLTFDASWASSDTNVATVSDAVGSKGFAQAKVAGTTTISATFGGVSGSTLLAVTEPVLQSITVTPDNPSLLSLSTSTFSFQATGHYSNGTTADITSKAVWASSVPDIATIAATGGAATALSKGTTTISASLNNVNGVTINGATNLNVTGGDVTGFAVSPAPLTLVKGTVARMTVLGTFDNGSSRDITGFVKWTPADPSLATVTTPGGNLAWLNALNVTSTPTVITTQVAAKSGPLTATTNLTVINPTLVSIAISPTSFTLAANTSTRFKVTATFFDGSTQDVTYSATWSSSNGAIASVGDSSIAKGRVSAVSSGSATISASYGGLTITAPVTVTLPTSLLATGITVSGAIAQGSQVRYKATAINGQDVTEDTTWSIDNSNIAILADQVNQPGQVVGVSKGATILKATFGVDTPTTTVTVQ